MPTVRPTDMLLRHISTSTSSQLSALPTVGAKYPFPLPDLILQVTSDRLLLAGDHLRSGDQLLLGQHFRSAISRYYYAMYTAARSIVYACVKGDDFERHNLLPRNLPATMPHVTRREQQLIYARLLRNEADYDIYPRSPPDWEHDARSISIEAAEFVLACEDFALTNGLI